MKTAALCLGCLIVGAIVGSLVTGYALKWVHHRDSMVMFAGQVTLDAMRAEQIGSGHAEEVLASLESSIPDELIFLNEDSSIRERLAFDTALKTAKGFYLCTKTPIPEKIAAILEPVVIAENACS